MKPLGLFKCTTVNYGNTFAAFLDGDNVVVVGPAHCGTWSGTRWTFLKHFVPVPPEEIEKAKP
jgi:hypothetical protein